MSTHQVVFLLLDLAVIVVLARLLGAVARRLDQPPVIGELLAGILLGPTLFGEGFAAALFPTDVRPFLAALANVGVAMFMFMVGLELEQTLLRGRGKLALTVSVSSIVLPFTLGVGLAFYLAMNRPVEHRLGFLLFIGAAMSVTAFPVLARILQDRGMLRTMLGGLALTCAAIGDVLAWCLLAVVVIVSGGASGTEQWLIVLGPIYVALMLWVVRPLLRKLFTAGVTGALPTVLAGALISGAVTELIGLHFIFGAFLFGVIVPREGTDTLRHRIIDRVEEFNSALLLPVFFIVSGLKVNLSTLSATGLVEFGLVLLVAIAGKFGGAFVGARLHGLPARKSAALATLMNTRGLTELIILTVGLQLGVLDQSLYSIMVAMAVITTAMAGPLLRLIYPASVIERDQAIEQARL
ncbi:cation/H(+) antiporter [Kibdelosporangium aridum]|uniref:Cation/H(+) antiporter n=2 Tax=Pseudonocardiaceae TaxID=2070 RepID=A0A428ZJ83_KIBAR|nr:cation:proton antiporter [Kibdelosporangium aridum]RSM88018.1 cation/H(+) antiporter [Kibdelosporangium aridum]CAB45049.1 putative integral membrane ion antiporter [Amycolatopsis orientalis]